MYELCCDMIDLLINMSEIYGQPNENNIRTINDDDDEEEEGYIHERECINDDDNEQQEWNLETQSDVYDENNLQLNGIESHSYINSMSIDLFYKD